MCKPDSEGPPLKKSAFEPYEKSDYVLPYRPGSEHLVWRTTSHFTPGNHGVGLHAIDLEMPVGTPIVASRSGKIVAIQDSFADGNDTDLQENYVMIEHVDKTIGRYIHLRKSGIKVRIGDLVSQGSLIAESGNSGQTGGPHLHFDVQKCGPNLPPRYNELPCGQTVPVNFRNTDPNECGLVANKTYRAH